MYNASLLSKTNTLSESIPKTSISYILVAPPLPCSDLLTLTFTYFASVYIRSSLDTALVFPFTSHNCVQVSPSLLISTVYSDVFILAASPPACAWLILNSFIIVSLPKSTVIQFPFSPNAHHLVFNFPSKANLPASFSLTCAFAIHSLFKARFVRPLLA